MTSKRTCLSIVLVLLFVTVVAPAAAGKKEAYGKPLTGSDTTAISTLMDDPDRYVGKTVRVEGLVTGVCQMRGCWMSLASDREFEELRIKVDDGVIVFPLEAKGRRAIAEGTFHKIEMTLEQTVAYKRHHAEEHGESFDPSTVTEPMTYYQIKGIGAVIED